MIRATDPRGRLLDAALAVIDSEGLRGLTHRRLEDEAGLARGSARYHLGTNDQIVAAALEHAVLRELQIIDAALAKLGRDALAGGTASLPKLFAVLTSALLETPGAIRARYELLLEATRRPSLKAEAQRWRAQFIDTTQVALTTAGLNDPHTTSVLLVAILDGMTLDAVITGRTTAPELAEIAAAAILHAADGEVGRATSP
jgi:DNA-binding transcriptional regulator YbjK